MSWHVGTIVSEFLRGGYRADCSCGWVGVARNFSDEAEADVREHLRSVRAAASSERPDGQADLGGHGSAVSRSSGGGS